MVALPRTLAADGFADTAQETCRLPPGWDLFLTCCHFMTAEELSWSYTDREFGARVRENVSKCHEETQHGAVLRIEPSVTIGRLV